MKKILGVFLITILTFYNSAFAIGGNGVVTLDTNEIEKPEIDINAVNKQPLEGSLLINSSEDISTIIDMQKEHDMEDKYLVQKKDNSLAQLQVQLDLENRKNLLRQRTLSNNQRVSALNSTSKIVDMISDALAEKQQD